MACPIRKERIHLMSPTPNVGVFMDLASVIPPDALKAAVQKAVDAHPILYARVEVAKDGAAAFVPAAAKPVFLTPWQGADEMLLEAQAALPFALEAGENIRFLYQNADGGTRLAAFVHHVVSDAGSMMLLFQDILRALNGHPVQRHEIRLLTREDLPAHPGLHFLMRGMMRRTARKWGKGGLAFTLGDARDLQTAFTAQHPAGFAVRRIRGEAFQRMLLRAKEHGVTVNSWVTAALAAQMPEGESIGIAVGVRPDNNTSIGNYATGVSIKPKQAVDFSAPACVKAVHEGIQAKLGNPRDKFFLYEFMDAMPPTLVDAMHFALAGRCSHPVALGAARTCGFVDNPKGLSVTNLTTIEPSSEVGDAVRCSGAYFVPPYVANVRAVVGVSSFADTMTLTLSVFKDGCWDEKLARFQKACDLLAQP